MLSCKVSFHLSFRQNGAPSGLENRGLDANFAFTTKQEDLRIKIRNNVKVAEVLVRTALSI